MRCSCFDAKNFRIIISKNNVLHSLIFSFGSILCFNPTHNLVVEKFTRQIGMGVMADYDVSVLVRHFYIWSIAFAILFVLFSFLFSFSRRRTYSQETVWIFLDDFSVVAFCGLCLSAVSFFQDGRILYGAGKSLTAICLFVYSAGLAYMLLPLSRIVTPSFYHKLVVSIFAFACFSVYAVPSAFYSEYNFYIILFVFLGLALLALFFARNIFRQDYFKLFADFLFSGIAFLPIIASFEIEGMYILNQHSVFIPHIKYIFLASFVLLLFASTLYAVGCKKKHKDFVLWRSGWVYPVLIAGIILCANQPPLQSVYSPDIFETANYSILISDFLNFGKLPVIEHYGGHMLLHVISGIFYGLVNNDFSGAIVSPYWNYFFPAVCGVLFFLFLKEIIGHTMAFFTCLIIPYEFFCVLYFAIGLAVFIAVIKYIKSPSFLPATLIWIAFAWAAISRLDLGFAVLGGTIFTCLFYCMQNKNKIYVKQLLLSFVYVAIAGGSIWCMLCLLKGINPIVRLYEFINISSSNPMWAYTTLGDISRIGYTWAYCFVPLCISGGIVYSLVGLKNRTENTHLLYLFLLAAFSFFANLPRTLVRHSFAEGPHILSIMLTAWLAIPLFIILVTQKKKNFIPSLVILYFVQYLIFFGNNNFALASYFSRFAFVDKNIQSPAPEKLQRVILSDNSMAKAHYEPLVPVLNTLLASNESFIDFTDTTFIYSALGKECPVYVSQSPSMLSGEFSQKQFVTEIQQQREKLPIALFPLSAFYLSQYIDGVPLVLRHYKISEYLYQNYRPLCTAGDYALWCDKEKYNKYISFFTGSSDDSMALSEDTSKLLLHNCTLIDYSMEITSQDADPYIDNFHSLLPENIEYGKKYKLIIDYESSISGIAQLFYANGNEWYSEEHSIRKNVASAGILDFTVTLNSDTKLRFDIPDGSVFSIKSAYLVSADEVYMLPVTYGYDLNLGFHDYNLNQLPYLWANKDIRDAKDNAVLAQLNKDTELYEVPAISTESKKSGNYILIHDLPSENSKNVSVFFGYEETGNFAEKYRISFTAREGIHDYILRPSIDYYWYTDEINALKFISANQDEANVSATLLLLEGD